MMAANSLQPFLLIEDYKGLDSINPHRSFYEAIVENDLEAAKWIDVYGANVNEAVCIALQEKRMDIAEQLFLKHSIDIHYQDQNGITFLEYCVAFIDDPSAWEFLINEGADPINHAAGERSILHFIIWNITDSLLNKSQKTKRLSFFLDKYPKLIGHINQYRYSTLHLGNTALHLAYLNSTSESEDEIVNLLLHYGAEKSIKNKGGYIPEDYAKKYYNQEWLICCVFAMGFESNADGLCFGGSWISMLTWFLNYYNPQDAESRFNEKLSYLYHKFALPAFLKQKKSFTDGLNQDEKNAIITEIKIGFEALRQQENETYLKMRSFLEKIDKAQSLQQDTLRNLHLIEPKGLTQQGGTKLIAKYISLYTIKQLVEKLRALQVIVIATNCPMGILLGYYRHVSYLGITPQYLTYSEANFYPAESITLTHSGEDLRFIANKIVFSAANSSLYIPCVMQMYSVGNDARKLSQALLESGWIHSKLKFEIVLELFNSEPQNGLKLWQLAKRYGMTFLEQAVEDDDCEAIQQSLNNLDFCQLIFNEDSDLIANCLKRAVWNYYEKDKNDALKTIRLFLSHPNVPIDKQWIDANKAIWEYTFFELKNTIDTIFEVRFPQQPLEKSSRSNSISSRMFNGFMQFFPVPQISSVRGNAAASLPFTAA